MQQDLDYANCEYVLEKNAFLSELVNPQLICEKVYSQSSTWEQTS